MELLTTADSHYKTLDACRRNARPLHWSMFQRVDRGNVEVI